MPTELVKELLQAGVHFGHQTKRWNPRMKPFIYGSRSGIYIIDLEKTEAHLKEACDFIEGVAAKGQQVLFVGTKKQARSLLQEGAKRCEMPYVISRWLGGTLTNFQTIKRNLTLLRDLRTKKAEGYFERLSKKDAKRLQRQLDKLEESFTGLADMERVPGCVFIVDTKREEIAVREANRLGIPIVAICDTNANPDLVVYPIPGNDDAIRSVKLIVNRIADYVINGRKRRLAIEQEERAQTEAQQQAEAKSDEKADSAAGSAQGPESPK